jgi:amidase
VYDYWQLNKRKWDLQQKYIDKWNSIRSPRTGSQVDVILMPAMPHSAVPHRGCRWVGYTKVWNVLDYSALVIPGGSVVQEDVNTPWDYEARGPLDEWTKRLWEERRSEMASSKLPVGVQLVCQKLEEEKLLAVGKIVDDLLRVN